MASFEQIQVTGEINKVRNELSEKLSVLDLRTASILAELDQRHTALADDVENLQRVADDISSNVCEIESCVYDIDRHVSSQDSIDMGELADVVADRLEERLYSRFERLDTLVAEVNASVAQVQASVELVQKQQAQTERMLSLMEKILDAK